MIKSEKLDFGSAWSTEAWATHWMALDRQIATLRIRVWTLFVLSSAFGRLSLELIEVKEAPRSSSKPN